MITTIIIMYQ